MVMKKNMKMKHLIGKRLKSFFAAYAVLIIVYFVFTIIFFIENTILHPGGLRAANKPVYMYLIKWAYAFILLKGIYDIIKYEKIAYVLLNSISVCVIFFIPITGGNYTSVIDIFLLEFVAICLLITLNRKHFIAKYEVRISYVQFVYIILIPLVITFFIYEFSVYAYENLIEIFMV
jgi:hypothetical protein